MSDFHLLWEKPSIFCVLQKKKTNQHVEIIIYKKLNGIIFYVYNRIMLGNVITFDINDYNLLVGNRNVN